MLWKMLCFTLQSMGRTNYKLPIYAARDVQTHPKQTLQCSKVSLTCTLHNYACFSGGVASTNPNRVYSPHQGLVSSCAWPVLA